MLKDLSIKIKLMLFPILFIGLFIILGSVYSYYKNLALSRNDISINVGELKSQLLNGRISAYQFLRNPNNETAQSVRNNFDKLKKDALEIKASLNLEENKKHVDNIVSFENEYITYFDKLSILRIKDFSDGIKDETSEEKVIISNMLKAGLSLENELIAINQSATTLRDEAFNSMNSIILVISIISIIIFLLLSAYISKSIIALLTTFQNGLLSFFAFLNKETSKANRINIDSKDEFGEMANLVNSNIDKTQRLISQDNQLIDNVKRVVEDVKQGKLDSKITSNTENKSLEELKNNFNDMIDVINKNICSDLNKLVDVLNSYAKLDFRAKINDNALVAKEVNNLGEIITNMLIENKSNGLTLQDSSNILIKNVNSLNVSSNSAAASLEETAAAIEEITSNIRNTTENIAKMSSLSSSVTKSSNNGEKLANKTTIAMDEINNQVDLITDAISVIDQIAFQTNILSLNAAVEAATAGEAGKGFAVVAQEVRNLAARSAEAAKEIKNIVENAKNKADEGKEIAGHMIDGYKELNENIQQTINLISDIEMSSKEQLAGIEQINDAVNSLDQQTQQNAQIASQTYDVATITDNIAKLVVDNANAKEFEGKNDVKAKNMNLSKDTSSHQIPQQTPKKAPIKSTPTKVEAKTITPKNDSDEWESF